MFSLFTLNVCPSKPEGSRFMVQKQIPSGKSISGCSLLPNRDGVNAEISESVKKKPV